MDNELTVQAERASIGKGSVVERQKEREREGERHGSNTVAKVSWRFFFGYSDRTAGAKLEPDTDVTVLSCCERV